MDCLLTPLWCCWVDLAIWCDFVGVPHSESRPRLRLGWGLSDGRSAFDKKKKKPSPQHTGCFNVVRGMIDREGSNVVLANLEGSQVDS